jgi:endoglucanase
VGLPRVGRATVHGAVWLGEFGTNHTSPSPVWWPWIEQYMTEKDLDWSFWALNGTQGKGYGRTFGAVETFGVLNAQWTDAASQNFLGALQALMPATTGP